MNPLYIITARGGSKGIPGKNIKLLAGRPLIAYTLDVAKAMTDPHRILVSTDSEAIATVVRQEGLEVPFMRPAELAADNSGSREVLLHAMDWATAHGIEYDCVVLLQPTSPLRTIEDVQRTLDLYTLYAPNIDMVTTVTEAPCNPYYDCFETGEDGFLRVSKGDGTITRRQDAPMAWQYTGAVYAINPDSLRRMTLGQMPRRAGCPVARERSIDLDTPADWLVAEMIMSNPEIDK